MKKVKQAFTLVELLVVIAVISILAAMLLPGVTRIRRSALVLGCPIAYIAADRTVWICDLRGGRQLQIGLLLATDRVLRWSPRGKKVAYLSSQWVVTVDPVTQATTLTPRMGDFTWVDEETLLGRKSSGGVSRLWRVNIRTGVEYSWKDLGALGLPCGDIIPQYDPVFTAGYVVCEGEAMSAPMNDITLRDQDWNQVGTVWEDPGNNWVDMNPRIDEAGEKVGWTRKRSAGAGPPYSVAVKRLGAPANEAPEMLGGGFDSVRFCDWIPHGRILVVVTQGGQRQLAIMDAKGELVSTLNTPRGIWDEEGVAVYRRKECW